MGEEHVLSDPTVLVKGDRIVAVGDEFGTVAVGLRADLLPLEANPLEDVGNAERIRGVVVRGRYLSRGDLDEHLQR